MPRKEKRMSMINELKPLTSRQQQIFDLIKENIQETGMPPQRGLKLQTFLALNQRMLQKNT